MHERMRKGWRGGLSDGTVCGIGSTLESTERVRAWLPEICERYGIKSIADAGAGDRHWIRRINWNGIRIYSYDLIPRDPMVVRKDITAEAMAPADAILCRHVLNHIAERVPQTLELFRRSARYLIATQFDRYDGMREFTRLDLREFLGEPLESVDDGGADGCRLAIWAIS